MEEIEERLTTYRGTLVIGNDRNCLEKIISNRALVGRRPTTAKPKELGGDQGEQKERDHPCGLGRVGPG